MTNIKKINDLRLLYREERAVYKVKIILAIFIVVFFILQTDYIFAAYCFTIALFVYILNWLCSFSSMKQLLKLPRIKENQDQKIGAFFLREVDEILEDVLSKMNPPIKMDARIVKS